MKRRIDFSCYRLVVAIIALAVTDLYFPATACASDVYGQNDTDVVVEPLGEWVTSAITIDSAPDCAVVTGIDVGFQAIHPYSADLVVDLTDAVISTEYRIWQNEGGSNPNPSRTVTGITAFNGQPVNQAWTLWAADLADLDVGYIDYWWIRIYYQIGSKTYSVYAMIDNFNGASDNDGDGYYDEFTFNVIIDADVSCGDSSVYARVVDNTTGQAWYSADPIAIAGDATDDAVSMSFSQSDFGGLLMHQSALDFTVEIRDLSYSEILASENSVLHEPIYSEVIPPAYQVFSGIMDVNSVTDSDGDGYPEQFQFDLWVDADVQWGISDVFVKIVCTTTGQSWWSENPIPITDTLSDDAVSFHFSEIDFLPWIYQRSNMDFRIEVWDPSRSQLLASDSQLDNEPVHADRILRLSDAVGILKMMTSPSRGSVEFLSDINKDGKIGLGEVAFILQRLSGIRLEEDPQTLYNGGGPSSDGGAIPVTSTQEEQGVLAVNGDGTALISSPELRSEFTVKIVQKGTQIPVSGMNIQWRAKNGRIELIAYDPSGVWAPVIYQGDPSIAGGSPGSTSAALAIQSDTRRPQILITGTLLLFGVVSLAVAELDYIFDVYRMSEFHVTNIADNGDGYGVFRCTVAQLAKYLTDYYGGKKATLSIATQFVFAGIPFPTEGWEVFGFIVESMLTEEAKFVIDQLNAVQNKLLYGTANENTEIWVQINNWQSVGNDFLYDVDIVILPVNWDDTFEDNDSFSQARTLEIRDSNGLVAYSSDPDYFKVYLNPGDNWQAKASFLNTKGDINLRLYNPNHVLVASSLGTENSETVSLSNVTVPGWYYLEVTNDGGQWSGNMYNLSVSGIGGEPEADRDLRFVLSWGEHPSDLDSHLYTPLIQGLGYHVYYNNPMDASQLPYVGLDVDDTDGYGPETISINELYPGTYHYSVYNFSEVPAITTSQAQVSVFDQFGLITEVTVPFSGSGLWWHVFEIDGESGNIALINQISATTPQ